MTGAIPATIIAEDVPLPPERTVERLRPYGNCRSANVCDWDRTTGGLMISTRFGDTAQLHHVAHPMGMREQLTFFPEPITSAHARPGSRQYLYLRDKGGNEFHQIYLFDVATNEHTLLSDGKSKHACAMWSHSGGRICYTSNAKNGKDVCVYVMDLATRKERLVMDTPGWLHAVAWSPDDSRILVSRPVSANETYYYYVDISGADPLVVPIAHNHHPGETKTAALNIALGEACWAGDGESVFITSDEGTDFLTLRHYHFGTKSYTKDLTKDIAWNVVETCMSPDYATMAFVANEDGYDVMYLLDTATLHYTRVDTPSGLILRMRWSPDGRRLAATLNTPQTPGDVFVMDVARGPAGGAARVTGTVRWTQSEVGGLDTSKFVLPTLHRFQSFDKLEVPTFLYKPRKSKAAGGSFKFPVVIHIHGGPESQVRPSFLPLYQYLVNELGIAVLDPNVRGSDGYGKHYLLLDNGVLRENSVKDIGALLDWVKQNDSLDENNVAVWGGSYGGYMVLASMVHYADRLRCGADMVGISNFVTFLERTQEYRRDLRRAEYGDERDPAMRRFLADISPLTNAHKINKPMLIAQGANDPRVPEQESRQVVDAVRKNGVEAQYILAKDEGHGFRKKTNIDYYQAALVSFLEKHLCA